MSLFVDTSAFYAAADRGDRGHERAAEALTSGDPLVTTDHVLIETWFLLDARLGRHVSQAFWSTIRKGAAEVATVGPSDLDRAWATAERFADQSFSIVDMTSFAVMERLALTRVASLDRHFAVYRYGPRHDRAFQVVL
jgi:predicted nucleic acid-binding protein